MIDQQVAMDTDKPVKHIINEAPDSPGQSDVIIWSEGGPCTRSLESNLTSTTKCPLSVAGLH